MVTSNTDTGLLHFLVCRRIPTPQDREHSLSSLQALQPPCTGLNGGRWLGITNFSSSMGTHFPSRHHWKRRKWKRYERNLEDTRNWIVRSLKPQSPIFFRRLTFDSQDFLWLFEVISLQHVIWDYRSIIRYHHGINQLPTAEKIISYWLWRLTLPIGKTSIQNPGLFYKLASFQYSCYFWPEIWRSHSIMSWFNYHVMSRNVSLELILALVNGIWSDYFLRWNWCLIAAPTLFTAHFVPSRAALRRVRQ